MGYIVKDSSGNEINRIVADPAFAEWYAQETGYTLEPIPEAPTPREATDIELAQQEITEKDLSIIELGQTVTEQELNAIQQGQAMTDLELMILGG